jgi:hypothetical protein
MRIRELLLVILFGACTSNPDPRSPSLKMMEREGFGSYIVITLRDGHAIEGELISVEPTVIRVLSLDRANAHPLTWVAVTDVRHAELYTYESEGGLGVWGTLGALSTISHGAFLAISAPIWAIVSGVVAANEASHIQLEYPKTSWTEIAKWARFPQGMPPGLDLEALTVPRAHRAAHPTPPGANLPPPAPPPEAPPGPEPEAPPP